MRKKEKKYYENITALATGYKFAISFHPSIMLFVNRINGGTFPGGGIVGVLTLSDLLFKFCSLLFYLFLRYFLSIYVSQLL